MADSYTKVTTTSWGSRLGGAFKGILFGIILFLVSFYVLFWNEGRSVKRYKALKEGQGAVVSVKADKVDPANEGKLVHVSGMMTTEDTITDPEFNVSVKALKLIRNVEMYQWIEEKKSETKKKLGGGEETITTYSYKKDWSSSVIDSSQFDTPSGHENPSSMDYKAGAEIASNVTLGAFKVPSSIVERVGNQEKLAVDDKTRPVGMKTFEGGFYYGSNPKYPQIGDQRITFEVVNPQDMSLVYKQVGDSFEPYTTKYGEVALLKSGIMTAEQMFEAAKQENKIFTWILRLVGFFMMFLGLSMILKPISVVLDVLPILGNIAGIGIGVVAFLVALPLSLITIAIAWIYYRPVLAIILLAIAGASIYLFIKMKKKNSPAAA